MNWPSRNEFLAKSFHWTLYGVNNIQGKCGQCWFCGLFFRQSDITVVINLYQHWEEKKNLVPCMETSYCRLCKLLVSVAFHTCKYQYWFIVDPDPLVSLYRRQLVWLYTVINTIKACDQGKLSMCKYVIVPNLYYCPLNMTLVCEQTSLPHLYYSLIWK